MRTIVKTAVSLALAAVALGSPGAALANSYTCTPTEVGVFADRLHVKCSAYLLDGGTAVWYFAVPATDTAFANRFLTAVNTAITTSRNVVVYYNPGDTSGNNWGCWSGDCRSIWGLTVPR